MDLLAWFEKGLSVEQYKNGMNVNRENMELIYERFELSEADKRKLSTLNVSGIKVIALTEDWCGDAMLNLPILLRIAEETKMDVRFILRDSNLELMDQYLTNGTSRSIPIFIFINQAGEEKVVWGPRAGEVQNLVDSLKSELPDKEAEDFQEKQKSIFNHLTKTFLEDEQIWKSVSSSITEKLKAI
ncbi:thioredoxin family protein [Evansella sp. LMS18]|uniref:thioredoxin family protein n=1 Tax=Evansella sp. LMS18 TaxID=2924033 RepID=UPI0020CFEB4D|nr:thioredoxin family protein [Evansella sp. LMS18]UTR09301.1 thioredoxin family protein [Evansella sp. LMS18]